MFLRIRPYEFPERSFLLKIRLFYSKTSFLFLIIFHYQKESKYSGFGDFCQNETSKYVNIWLISSINTKHLLVGSKLIKTSHLYKYQGKNKLDIAAKIKGMM